MLVYNDPLLPFAMPRIYATQLRLLGSYEHGGTLNNPIYVDHYYSSRAHDIILIMRINVSNINF
jgi:hypothetical protein